MCKVHLANLHNWNWNDASWTGIDDISRCWEICKHLFFDHLIIVFGSGAIFKQPAGGIYSPAWKEFVRPAGLREKAFRGWLVDQQRIYLQMLTYTWTIRCFHCVSIICTSKCEGRWLKLRGLTIKNDRWIVCHISLHALSALRRLKLPASGYRSVCVLAAYISMTYPTQ